MGPQLRAPGAWRVATGIAGTMCLLYALIAVTTRQPPPVILGYGDPTPILLALSALALAFGMARKGGVDAVYAFGGIAAGLLLGFVLQSFFGFFLGIGLGVPAALLAARPHRVATFLAAVGFAGLMLAGATMARVGDVSRLEVDSFARGAIFAVLFVLLGVAFMIHAIAARGDTTEGSLPVHAGRPIPAMPSRLPLAIVALFLLAISWLLDGRFEWIWLVAFGTLAALPLLQARAWPVGAATTVGLAMVGVVPVAHCGIPLNLAFVAGSGPGHALTQGAATCAPPTLFLFGIAWAGALAVVAIQAARLRGPVAVRVQ